LLKGRRYDFELERAIYLTVLHRLFASGSDRAAERWRENYLTLAFHKITPGESAGARFERSDWR
jgi:hypothetical protein